MTLIVRKALNLLIAITNNPSENIWDEFTKMSKIGPSMESLNADWCSSIFCQNYQKFCFKGTLSGLKQFLANESTLKMMKLF